MTQRPTTLVVVLCVLLAGQLVVALCLGLGDAEALYYVYSRHLSLSYLDHPPLIGWLIRGSTALFGPTVIGVRLVPMITTVLGTVFLYLFTRELFGAAIARLAPLLILSTPVFAVGLTAATPDAPLFAIWPLYLWQLHVALSKRSQRVQWLRPLMLGVLLGLAFLAKYTGALLVVTTLIMVLSKPHRKWLRAPGFWLGAGIAALLALPVFLWNMNNGFAGVYHRLQWTQTGAGISVRNAGALLGGQLLYVGPVMLVLLFLGARRMWQYRRDDAGQEYQLLLAASLPVLAVTYFLGLWSDVAEPHWPAPGYLALYPAASALIGVGQPAALRLYRIALSLGIAIYLIMLTLVLTPLLPIISPPSSYEPKYDLANELRGWSEVAEMIRRVRPKERPVIAAHYTQCAQLAFVLSRPSDPVVRCISKETDDFDLWDGPFSMTAAGALFVTDNRFNHDVGGLLQNVDAVSSVTVEIQRNGVLARRFVLTEMRPIEDTHP